MEGRLFKKRDTRSKQGQSISVRCGIGCTWGHRYKDVSIGIRPNCKRNCRRCSDKLNELPKARKLGGLTLALMFKRSWKSSSVRSTSLRGLGICLVSGVGSWKWWWWGKQTSRGSWTASAARARWKPWGSCSSTWSKRLPLLLPTSSIPCRTNCAWPCPVCCSLEDELDHLQQQISAALGAAAVYLLGWAWQRRQILAPSTTELVKGFPSSWQPLAKALLQAWDRAVRASSAVENWHSILRPHLAVHRTLSAEMLALLAVWHHHRVAARGLQEGQTPLQRSGLAKAATDWLVALGYPPASPSSAIRRPVPVTIEEEVLAA
jgi:hypothetical protein